MSKHGVPFGLLFAEPVAPGEPEPAAVYSEEMDVSVVEVDDAPVPLVTVVPWVLGTFTETRISGEHTDAD